MKRVLLADDHTLMLEGLIGILHDDYEIVGTAENGRALLRVAERLQPDLILLDISMPELNGIEAARRMCDLLPKSKLIFLTQQLKPEYVRAALEIGVMAYVAKQSASDDLKEAIRLAELGRYYVTPLVACKDQYQTPAHAWRSNS